MYPYLVALALLLLVQAGLVGKTGTNNPFSPPPPPPSGSPTCNVGICSLGGNCTGAVGSCAGGTCSGFTSATGFSTVQALAQGAGDDDVVCLERGQIWSTPTGMSLTVSHPNAHRTIICASDAQNCSDSGAANPRVSMTADASAVTFTTNSGGYTIQNLDTYSTSSASSFNPAAWMIAAEGIHDVSVAGVVIDGFYRAFGATIPGATPLNYPTGINFGQCGGVGHWVEIRGGPSVLTGKSNRAVTYGSWVNSSISIYVHDWLAPSGSFAATSHMLDMGDGNTNFNGSLHDLDLQCSRFEHDRNGAHGDGVPVPACMNKFNRGYNLRFHDNDCREVAVGANNGASCFCFATHNSGGQEGVGDTTGTGTAGAGAKIYRNTFTNQQAVFNHLASDVDIYNNIFDFTLIEGDGSGPPGLYQTSYKDANPEDIDPIHIRIFNNTLYQRGSNTLCGGGCGYGVMFSTEAGQGSVNPSKSTNNEAFNNVIQIADTIDAKAVTFSNSSCSEFGTNGANMHDNFVYSPGDSTPALGGCSAADFTKSGATNGNDGGAEYNVTAPGFNTPGTDFDIAAGSRVYHLGTTTNCPADDYAQVTRPGGACSIGAYDAP